VAPLRLGGLRGKQSTPSVWLGGTGEPSAVGERERQGARDAARSAGRLPRQAKGNGMILIGEVECIFIFGNLMLLMLYIPFILRSHCIISFCRDSGRCNLNDGAGMCNL
jgi:hypothetical protein